jgi:hypothetical protein
VGKGMVSGSKITSTPQERRRVTLSAKAGCLASATFGNGTATIGIPRPIAWWRIPRGERVTRATRPFVGGVESGWCYDYGVGRREGVGLVRLLVVVADLSLLTGARTEELALCCGRTSTSSGAADEQDDEPGLILQLRGVHHGSDPGHELRDDGADHGEQPDDGQRDQGPAGRAWTGLRRRRGRP